MLYPRSLKEMPKGAAGSALRAALASFDRHRVTVILYMVKTQYLTIPDAGLLRIGNHKNWLPHT